MKWAMVGCIYGNCTSACRDLKGKDLSALTIYLERKQWFQRMIRKETDNTGCSLWNLEMYLTGEALPLISQS